MVRMQSVALVALLLAIPGVHGQEEQLRPQTPEASMRKFVAALAARDMEKAKQALIGEATYSRTMPKKWLAYSAFLTQFEQSVTRFLAQQQPVEKMQFVRIDNWHCAQPAVFPKGFRGLREMCVMYDNAKLIVDIEGRQYSFKVDELIAADGKWALLDSIGLLEPCQE